MAMAIVDVSILCGELVALCAVCFSAVKPISFQHPIILQNPSTIGKHDVRLRFFGGPLAVEEIVQILFVVIEQRALLIMEESQDLKNLGVHHLPFVLEQPLDFGVPALLFLLQLGAVARVSAVSAVVGEAEVVVDALIEYPRPADDSLLALRRLHFVHQALPFFSVLVNLLFLGFGREVDPLPHAIAASNDGGNFRLQYDGVSLDNPMAGHYRPPYGQQGIQYPKCFHKPLRGLHSNLAFTTI
jgi:hypothetical protein